ncbi:Membrane dipeptidase (Peptidase family M19) [Acididesulfobacillus acetoxydans]|uniref:Dipeptidase 2 n=1 Tax=Acididesulfobacillus acetoxydans TaxID=1561005 RepID=A0A8S0W4K6_9FIRM|nr:dipeptidase [Acididesulfobacillus acetoxydans]CAA7602488.1 Membrane dipeptidase (Peptidase family M19) [Acididesulfobacillus acetoxydans]CEJ05943.1 Dipeptidase 2 [Acididesulfobacillus acetoxydans]
MNKPYVIDGHCDSIGDYSSERRSLRGQEGGQWDLERARRGRVGVQFMAAFIESEYKPARATMRGLELIAALHRFVSDNGERVFLIQGRDDLKRIEPESKTGLLLSVEGGEILGESLFLLDIIHRLGVRALGLTWNQRNAIGDGVGEQGSQGRLSHFGERVVRRLNELGMIVDVSHLNEAGFWHVLELSSAPIVASHSCARALCDHPRNLTDGQLKALARNKGVVGLNFCPAFLSDSGRAERRDVVRHISHIAEVAGVDVIGLGSDFDGIAETPDGLENVSTLPLLAEDLERAGFSSQEIGQIYAKNFERLLSNVLR